MLKLLRTCSVVVVLAATLGSSTPSHAHQVSRLGGVTYETNSAASCRGGSNGYGYGRMALFAEVDQTSGPKRYKAIFRWTKQRYMGGKWRTVWTGKKQSYNNVNGITRTINFTKNDAGYRTRLVGEVTFWDVGAVADEGGALTRASVQRHPGPACKVPVKSGGYSGGLGTAVGG